MDLETHFSYPPPQLHLPWGPLRQNFKTICNSYLKHCLKNPSPTMKMGETLLLAQEMISYPIFLSFCCHTFSFPAFFFFFPLSFYRFGVSFFHKLHNHNDSTIKVSSVSPLGEIVLCFCCIPTHNLHHQRACSIPHYYLFNLIFFPL